jgi:hypothetical protein
LVVDIDRSLLDDDPLTPTVTTGPGDHSRPVIRLRSADAYALAADLRRRCGADYETVVADGPAVLGAVAEPVALAVADREDDLSRVHEVHPSAKRVLLATRGDWSAAAYLDGSVLVQPRWREIAGRLGMPTTPPVDACDGPPLRTRAVVIATGASWPRPSGAPRAPRPRHSARPPPPRLR